MLARPNWTIIPKDSLAWWCMKILLVLAPAAVTGHYALKTARAEADAGYKTLVTRVDEHEKTQDALIKEMSYVRGEVEGHIQMRHGSGGGKAPTPSVLLEVAPPMPEPVAPAPEPAKAPPARKPLPRNLNEAVQQKAF